MGTKVRIWFEGAAYHVTARGNHKDNIFREREDFQVYLSLIEQSLEYYKDMYNIICYCLMSNHVHILVKANDSNIGRFIGRTNAMYAKWFNDKYKFVGHLFQDRYYAELIENDIQMLTASRYIHLNPVRANIVKNPRDYQWSSYSMVLGQVKSRAVKPEYIRSYFERNRSGELYSEFVERGYQYPRGTRILTNNKLMLL